MSDVLEKIYSPTPGKFTPEQEMGFQKWRAEQLARWSGVFAKAQQGPIQASEPLATKRDMVMKYYGGDSNYLRQEYLDALKSNGPTNTTSSNASSNNAPTLERNATH